MSVTQSANRTGAEDNEIGQLIRLGIENKRIIELAEHHCRLMEFVQDGGRGMLEAETGLPINMRRVQCPVALGNSAMRLDWITLEFYGEHCIGCSQRQPTGRVPNLATEYEAQQAQVSRDAEQRAQHLQREVVAWRTWAERRRAMRAAADLAMQTVIDDLSVLDHRPLRPATAPPSKRLGGRSLSW
jgi:hypothetical protein